MKQFQLAHLVLYAKGWYKKTDDIWEDLKKILVLDDYTPFTKNDVYIVILGCFSRAEFDYRANDLRPVLEGIHPAECWKFGYYTKGCTWVKNSENLPEYDMQTAFIYYVLSKLKFLEMKYYKFAVPKYKLYPKNPNIPLKNVIERFNRKLINP